MARRYASVFDNISNAAGTTSTKLSVISAATCQPKIYDWSVGASSASTPADQATNYLIQRFTADGTGTSFTPIGIDPNAGTAGATSKVNYTTDSASYTAGAILMEIGLNMRATFRWISNPDGELICPSTAANGLGLRSSAPSAAYNICGYAHWAE
jgi:hypothetical protein